MNDVIDGSSICRPISAGDDGLVPGRGDRQELGEALDDAEDDGLQQRHPRTPACSAARITVRQRGDLRPSEVAVEAGHGDAR